MKRVGGLLKQLLVMNWDKIETAYNKVNCLLLTNDRALLKHVAANPGAMIKDICFEAQIFPSAIRRSIERLKENGFIKQEKDYKVDRINQDELERVLRVVKQFN